MAGLTSGGALGDGVRPGGWLPPDPAARGPQERHLAGQREDGDHRDHEEPRHRQERRQERRHGSRARTGRHPSGCGAASPPGGRVIDQPRDGGHRDGRRIRLRGGRARLGDVDHAELERLESAEAAAHQVRGDVDPVALVDGIDEVAATEGDPVEHVDLAAQRELGMATGGRPDPRHGEAMDADDRVGIPGAGRAEGGEVAQQPRSRRIGPATRDPG